MRRAVSVVRLAPSLIWRSQQKFYTMFYDTVVLTENVLAALRVAIWSGLDQRRDNACCCDGHDGIFLDALRQSPSDLAEFAKSGDQSLSHFLYVDALAGWLNHLWIGPAYGVILGSIGAIAGKQFYRTHLSR